jgi:hypothetical protein
MENNLDCILIREDHRTVNYIVQHARWGNYVLPPQDATWSVELRSYFIESILMRIPIPAFYFSETSQGKYVVLNGLTRFEALLWFYGGGRLSSVIPELDGLTFVELPGRLLNRLHDARVLLYYIEYSVPVDMHREILVRTCLSASVSASTALDALSSFFVYL